MGFSDYDVLPYHIIDLFTPQRKHQGNDQELSPFYHHHHHLVQADLAMLDHNLWGRLPNLVGMEIPFFVVVPGAGTGQLGRFGAPLFGEWWTCNQAPARMGGVGVLSHPSWVVWIQRHRFVACKEGRWKGQGWLTLQL